MAGIELDRDDVLRFVTAEAKKLKIENLSFREQIATLEADKAHARKIIGQLEARLTELENLLEEATKPKTAIVPAGDPLVEDLSFLGYPTPAAR